MNDLKDFDFFSDYSYTHCARHLEEDGWSRQEWKQVVNLYKKKLKAFEIIKETWRNSILSDIEKGFVFGCPYTELPSKEKIDLLKEVLL